MLQVHSYQCFPLNTGQRWQPEQQLSGAKPIRLPGGHLQTWFASGSVEFSYSCLIWGNKGFSGGSMVRNLPANARDIRGMGLIPTSGRSPGGRHGNPLQYSCLEYPIDRITRTSGFLSGSEGKKICLQCRRPGVSPWVGKIPWRREVATHCKILGLENPINRGAWRLQSLGLQRVGHDWAT